MISWMKRLSVHPIATLSAFAIMAYAVSLVTAPIIARLFTPASVGTATFFTTLVSLGALISTGRYETALVVARRENEARALARLTARLIAGGTLLLTLTGTLFWHYHSASHSTLTTVWFAVLFPLSMGLTALIALSSALLQRAHNFRPLGQGRLTFTVATFCTQAISSGLQSKGLIFGNILGSATQLWNLRSARPMFAGWTASWKRDRPMAAVARRHAAFPKLVLPSTLLDALAQQLPILLGFTLISPTFAAFYGLATRLLQLPASLLGNAVAQVFYPQFSRLMPNRLAAEQLLLRTWMQLAAVSAPFFLAVAFYGPTIFKWAFGARWTESGELAAVLSPMLFAMFVSSPTSSSLLSMGRQGRALTFSIVVSVYRSLCLAWGASTGEIYFALLVLSLLEIAAIISFNLLLLRDLRHSNEPS